MKLITEQIEDVKILQEEKDGKKNYFIEGVFLQAEVKNRNGRMYPLSLLQKEVARYNKELIETNRALGELFHPDGPTINLDRVSHKILSLKEDGNNFIGRAKVLDTPHGTIVKNLLDEGVSLGVSSRGMGSLKTEGMDMQIVQDDFYLATAADIVADPSAPDAFVNGILESKEWVWDNGILREQQISEYKNRIEKATKKEIKEISIKIFEDFINKLSKKI